VCEESGVSTLDFILTCFWLLVVLFIFTQLALIGYTWQVAGYASFASARSRIVEGVGDPTYYKTVARNVMSRSLPDGWGSTWIVQELPFGIGVFILYWKDVNVLLFDIPVPVLGRSTVPYSKFNPLNPSHYVWWLGDND
jgi:hypothetical protein